MTGVLQGSTIHLIGRNVQISDRIRWVLIPEKSWWPAVVYESYSELQKDIYPQHNALRAKILLQRKKKERLGKCQGPVAFLFGFDLDFLLDLDVPKGFKPSPNWKPQPFEVSSRILQELEHCNKIMDFFSSYDEIVHSSVSNGDFSKAVDHVLTILEHEVQQEGTLPHETITPTKPAITNCTVLPNDSWSTAWEKLQTLGWNCVDGNIYLPPNKTIPRGTENVDFFSSKEAVQDFLQYKYDWTGDKHNDNVTPTDRNLAIQNHVSDESPIFPSDPWVTVWTKLVRSGWRLEQVTDTVETYYFLPGKSDTSHGLEGIDYFTSEGALIEYIERKYNWNGSFCLQRKMKANEKSKKRKSEDDDTGRPLFSVKSNNDLDFCQSYFEKESFIDRNNVNDCQVQRKKSKVMDIFVVESLLAKSNQVLDDIEQEAAVVESPVTDAMITSSFDMGSPTNIHENTSLDAAYLSSSVKSTGMELNLTPSEKVVIPTISVTPTSRVLSEHSTAAVMTENATIDDDSKIHEEVKEMKNNNMVSTSKQKKSSQDEGNTLYQNSLSSKLRLKGSRFERVLMLKKSKKGTPIMTAATLEIAHMMSESEEEKPSCDADKLICDACKSSIKILS